MIRSAVLWLVEYAVGALTFNVVRVGMGTADVRYRPEYRGWSLEVPIEFNSELISVGLGEWRPQKDGIHGRFKVEG